MGVAHRHEKMRNITHCPNCQTQFFVSESQLNQHAGLVRCGQCLHVFNAKEQFVSADTTTNEVLPSRPTNTEAIAPKPSDWPTIDNTLAESAPTLGITNTTPSAVTNNTLVDTRINEKHQTSINETLTAAEHAAFIAVEDFFATEPNGNQPNETIAIADVRQPEPSRSEVQPDKSIHNLNFTNHSPNDFNDLAKHAKLDGKKLADKRHRLLWASAAFILLLIALGQCVYFLRHTIATYYPNLKPHLLQVCKSLKCSIELPKQIEWIVIDDSDMQEDLKHAGIMHLSTNLLNKAAFTQAYPHLELTLTNTEDNAVLRRRFKPAEYLPPQTDVSIGFAAGKEIKVKLAITTQDVGVAGYRLYVSY